MIILHLFKYSNSRRSFADDPTIAGIAKKNENSAAIGVDNPAIHPPMIVDALLDIPGHTASTWNAPTFKAWIGVMLSKLFVACFLFFLNITSKLQKPTNLT